MAVAAPTAISVRVLTAIIALVSVGLGPRASLAQVRSVANEDSVSTEAVVTTMSPLEQWEEAVATHVSDADTWSAIGQRLYAAERYRECIAAFEQSLVLRNRQSRDDAGFIAKAYEKLGNAKQASRWSAFARGIPMPSGRRARIAV